MHGRGTWEEREGAGSVKNAKRDNVESGKCKEGKKGFDKDRGGGGRKR
jgi:hypothetical protein